MPKSLKGTTMKTQDTRVDATGTTTDSLTAASDGADFRQSRLSKSLDDLSVSIDILIAQKECLVSTLRLIVAGNPDNCACDHETDDCCAKIDDICCAYCLAATTLTRLNLSHRS